jgi:hypothetical protein
MGIDWDRRAELWVLAEKRFPFVKYDLPFQSRPPSFLFLACKDPIPRNSHVPNDHFPAPAIAFAVSASPRSVCHSALVVISETGPLPGFFPICGPPLFGWGGRRDKARAPGIMPSEGGLNLVGEPRWLGCGFSGKGPPFFVLPIHS